MKDKELAKKLDDLYFKLAKEDKELLEKILDAFEDVAERHFKAINLIKKAIAIKDITGNATLNLNELLETLGDKENE